MPAIERNWQTLWEPYRYYRDEKRVSHDVFWGWGQIKANKEEETTEYSFFPIYEKTSEKKLNQWNIGKGFIGRKEIDEAKAEYTLLWFINFEVNR